jgi:integrase
VILSSCAAWTSRPVATIRFQEVQQLLWLVRDGDPEQALKPRPYLANRLHSHLRALFNWCVRTKAIAVSPMQDMQRPWSGAKRRERQWFAKAAGDEAIKTLWRCADQLGGNDGRYVKLMLLTGKRKTALASMRWEEIDDNWFWDPPASQARNKRLHGVPLPPLAQRVLHPRQNRGKVFDGVAPIALQNKLRAMSGIEDFFWHGLRHLAETKTAELRDGDRPLILPHVRDMLFDHAPKRGTGQSYDHHDYVPDMRAAMAAWSDYVEQLVMPEGVALLR